jgi:murein L,D-transpeptidase YafK
MKRLYVLLSILVLVTVALVFKPYLKTMLPTSIAKNQKTVADRLQEYGSQAHARLKPFFEAKQVAYPPGRITMVGLKAEKILEVYAGGTNQNLRFIRSYPILAASGVAGPKLREGDQQVPEGVYPVEWLNPNSSYHLSFRIGYPNEFDREQARHEGRTKLGGDIMIHGDAVSIGCLAVGDEASEDLFVLAADTGITNITVLLSPVDFRKGKGLTPSAKLPSWTGPLYQAIKARLQELPLENDK